MPENRNRCKNRAHPYRAIVRTATEKAPVVVLVERNSRMRAKPIKRVNAKALKGAVGGGRGPSRSRTPRSSSGRSRST